MLRETSWGCGAGTVAQSVEGLLCRHEDPSWISRLYMKEQGIVACACHLSAADAEAGGDPGLSL